MALANKIVDYAKDFYKNAMWPCIFIFVVISLIKLVLHMPWADEGHAWCLAHKINLSNWLSLIRIEGHPLLWYLLIMPFAKFNLWYPYPMLLINWLFGLGCIFLIWKKAPFNNLLKIILTFSPLFISYFSIVARDYTMGILGLLLLCAYYNDKLDMPIKYTLIIVFIMNTHLVNIFAALPIAIVFMLQLLKKSCEDKKFKDFLISLTILISSVVIWFYVFANSAGTSPVMPYHKPMGWDFFHNIFAITGIYSLIFVLSMIYSLLFLLFYKKLSSFFIMVAYSITITFHILVYRLDNHILLYLFIYLIIAFWFAKPEFNNSWKVKLLYVAMIIIFTHPMNWVYYTINIKIDPQMLNLLKSDEYRIIVSDSWNIFTYYPYLLKKGTPMFFKEDFSTIRNKAKHVIYFCKDALPGVTPIYFHQHDYLYRFEDYVKYKEAVEAGYLPPQNEIR